ncbi:MAG: hypothetical protein D8M58_13920 [Calditrichaeota bacterium]|nr:MAG: hypothetical protein DWQ03_15160 [Calditrichota bacterium]MBL1206497.1 hypothetical protein [Calditrichota bacterium]NOG46324.1 hypothetical protein [Calditrichota bacterium]
MRRTTSLSEILFFCVLNFILIQNCSEPSGTDKEKKENPTQLSLSDFESATTCKGCHPTHYDEWKGSMHAYAFVDPLNTKMRSDLSIKVGKETLGGFCLQCHSPIAVLTGNTEMGFDRGNADPIVMEGITCDVCHLMEKASPTAVGEAEYHFDVTSGKRYANLDQPVKSAFHKTESKEVFSKSEICLPCHDLINQNGVEAEITFTEWERSPYKSWDIECQGCHMETYSGKAAVNGPERPFLHRHDFVGVDVSLLDDFPNQEKQRQQIEKLLKTALEMEVNVPSSINPDSVLKVDVKVKNTLTGHDVPSSVTFVRQVWLEVSVSSGGDTIYKSGFFDANGDLKDGHSVLEPGADPNLVIFQSALFNGGSSADVFTADSIYIGSIAPLEVKKAQYSIFVPQSIGSELTVNVRLRFRAIPPYILRDIDESFVKKIPVFDMEAFATIVEVI